MLDGQESNEDERERRSDIRHLLEVLLAEAAEEAGVPESLYVRSFSRDDLIVLEAYAEQAMRHMLSHDIVNDKQG